MVGAQGHKQKTGDRGIFLDVVDKSSPQRLGFYLQPQRVVSNGVVVSFSRNAWQRFLWIEKTPPMRRHLLPRQGPFSRLIPEDRSMRPTAAFRMSSARGSNAGTAIQCTAPALGRWSPTLVATPAIVPEYDRDDSIQINCGSSAQLQRFVGRDRKTVRFLRPMTPLPSALLLGTILPLAFYALGALSGALAAAYVLGSYAAALSIEIHTRSWSRQNVQP
jgi:hypothetical protein